MCRLGLFLKISLLIRNALCNVSQTRPGNDFFRNLCYSVRQLVGGFLKFHFGVWNCCHNAFQKVIDVLKSVLFSLQSHRFVHHKFRNNNAPLCVWANKNVLLVFELSHVCWCEPTCVGFVFSKCSCPPEWPFLILSYQTKGCWLLGFHTFVAIWKMCKLGFLKIPLPI